MVHVRIDGMEGCESTARLVILRSEGDGIACYAKGMADNYRSRDSLDYTLRLSTKQRAVSMVQRGRSGFIVVWEGARIGCLRETGEERTRLPSVTD